MDTSKPLVVLSIILFLTMGTESAGTCKPRSGNYDSVYCVCDASGCDSMDPITRTLNGLVQIFESDRAGKRLTRRQQFFNGPESSDGIPWNITINREKVYQEIIGFGGAFSDAAAIGIGKMSETLRRSILSEYYSENGIEYSMGRSVISGSDFSDRPYTYDDTPGDFNLTEFSLVNEDILYKIPQMKMAAELSPHEVKYFASSWSPPAWMKTSNSLIGQGTLKEGAGSLTWQTYAKYLLRHFDAYKSAGIKWWGMTVQNEPATGLGEGHPWNTCGFTPEMERDFVKTDLGPILEAGGYPPADFTILFLDHNRDILHDWADVILADPDATKYVKGAGVHWYGNYIIGPEVYDEYHERHPDHILLATEACNRGPMETDRVALGSWVLGEEYAIDILTDLLHWVTGWVDWNLVLDVQGGPNWAINYHSAPIIVNPDAGEYYKNTQFYAMAHFSKFLPPGSKRIGTYPEIIDNGAFKVGVFLRPDDATVIIAVNTLNTIQGVTINDQKFGKVVMNVGPHSFNTWLYY